MDHHSHQQQQQHYQMVDGTNTDLSDDCAMSCDSQEQKVEDLTDRLNQMNVCYSSAGLGDNNTTTTTTRPSEDLVSNNMNRNRNPLAGFSDLNNIKLAPTTTATAAQTISRTQDAEDSLMDDVYSSADISRQNNTQQESVIMMDKQQNNNNSNSSSNILIVTNVDPIVFNDKLTQSKFESLFRAHDPEVAFRYLKSFRRVRLDFTTSSDAESARNNLTGFKIGDNMIRCYLAQLIKPPQQQQQNENTNYGNNLNNCYTSNNHLNIPKLTKQFLISPPASPPVGWEPVTENSPCIDVQLISAIANLVPGKVHEIHQGNESQPGIFVEVCEDAQFNQQQQQLDHQVRQQQTSRQIPKTPSPMRL